MSDLGERAHVGIGLTKMEVKEMLRHKRESPGKDKGCPLGQVRM
jgi:hypothetical protein